MATALVRCDCGWQVQPAAIAVPVAVTLAPHAAEMIRHWRDGHRLSCQAQIRYQVRDMLKRYRQIIRAPQDEIFDREDAVRRVRTIFKNRFGEEDWS